MSSTDQVPDNAPLSQEEARELRRLIERLSKFPLSLQPIPAIRSKGLKTV